jgi:hypothetical protein
MAAVPSIILVFDVSALSAASCSEWREFARVGNCYIPQVVYEEIKMMFDLFTGGKRQAERRWRR